MPDGTDPNAWILGIDEAGRGSVLGPLVVGGFLARRGHIPQLTEMGVRDSKELRPAQREELYEALGGIGRREQLLLHPPMIDRFVAHHGLNELEARAFGRLVRTTAPHRAYVDACDTNAPRFGARVAHWGGVPLETVVARHKADRDLPIVAAASIVAKVVRDRAIARLGARLGTTIGSGYPADPITRDFVRDSLLHPASAMTWLRHSWATTETLKPHPPTRTLESFPT
ncbi:MAG: ribonuclease HII [Thermoplasmata archaeon]|nr:ribonuclease HII [Thermoplasmata archaeon]